LRSIEVLCDSGFKLMLQEVEERGLLEEKESRCCYRDPEAICTLMVGLSRPRPPASNPCT
jgi:hypothetical protein